VIACITFVIVYFKIEKIPNTNTNIGIKLDILNNFEVVKELHENNIRNIRIFRERRNFYLNNNTTTKLILLGEGNDIRTSSVQFNTVEDIGIVILGSDNFGNDIFINRYEYTLDNRNKALNLKNYLANI
jgi:hypothetical protein